MNYFNHNSDMYQQRLKIQSKDHFFSSRPFILQPRRLVQAIERGSLRINHGKAVRNQSRRSSYRKYLCNSRSALFCGVSHLQHLYGSFRQDLFDIFILDNTATYAEEKCGLESSGLTHVSPVRLLEISSPRPSCLAGASISDCALLLCCEELAG